MDPDPFTFCVRIGRLTTALGNEGRNSRGSSPLCSMSATSGGAAPAFAATATVSAAELASWPSGFVTFYIRGQDANGWGLVGSVVLNLDKVGPASNALSLAPEPSNGSVPVLLRATGDDHSTGRNPVVSAVYSIDGGASAPMTLARTDSPITAMTATLTITDLGGLAEGLHPIAVVSTDSLGNVGAPGVITLTLDQTGPAPSTE